jgi:hypothetical protein
VNGSRRGMPVRSSTSSALGTFDIGRLGGSIKILVPELGSFALPAGTTIIGLGPLSGGHFFLNLQLA